MATTKQRKSKYADYEAMYLLCKSGTKMRDFCRERHISYPRFKAWLASKPSTGEKNSSKSIRIGNAGSEPRVARVEITGAANAVMTGKEVKDITLDDTQESRRSTAFCASPNSPDRWSEAENTSSSMTIVPKERPSMPCANTSTKTVAM